MVSLCNTPTSEIEESPAPHPVLHEAIKEYAITCPYCWEVFSIWQEKLEGDIDVIEDCQVCCNPIQILLQTDSAGEVSLHCERAM